MESHQRPLSRRQSATNLGLNDAELSRSLQKLSLSTSPVALQPTPTRSPNSLSPHRLSANLTSPAPRPSARSPSTSRESRSRSSTPTLLRKASTSSLRSAGGGGRTASQPPSRRSSHVMASSPISKALATPSVPEEPPKPPPTANTVASAYFKTDVEAHNANSFYLPPDVLVVLQDACYGHRYSRPKTSRTALSTIVERPERMKASALGIALAYVRLGGRHCDGAFPVHPKLDPATLPVPFLMHKTARRLPLTSAAVTNVHGVKWMEELKAMCDSAEHKLAMGGKELQRPDSSRGSEQKAHAKLHEGDLYLCAESLGALEGALGAVCEAVDRVFTTGPSRAFVAIRPPGHHCSASYPSGFCWINNVHIGIMHAILNHGLTHAAIIDFDLHHGDGSQAITWQHNARAACASKNAAAWKRASIGYFSLHDINSYPCEMGDEEKVKNASLCIENAHGQNIWNVHLYPWDSEDSFWRLYETKYAVLIEKTRLFLRQQASRLRTTQQDPKAAIFFSAGFDASEWETKGMQRHNVNVPTEFYARLSQDVVNMAAEEGLAVEGRIISVLEGGYSDRALFSGIFSHMSGLVCGNSTPSGQAMAGTLDETGGANPGVRSNHFYDPSWWSDEELNSLEAAMGSPTPEPKKPRYSTPPTYSSPTQASTAKVVNPLKLRRSASNLFSLHGMSSRPPTPPPPDVPWTIAVHELSKQLIPSDRQTESCKAEDLNAEATRARRDRQSLLNPPTATATGPAARPTSRMSLRERRPVRPAPNSQQVSRGENERDKAFKGRRKTVAVPSVLDNQDMMTVTGTHDLEEQSARQPSMMSNTGHMMPVTGFRSTSGPHDTTQTVAQGEDWSAPAAEPQLSDTPSARKAKAPTVPRGGMSRPTRGGRKAASSKIPAIPQPVSPPIAEPDNNPEIVAGSKVTDDLERITSGMKKIRINLITKTQKEERARADLDSAGSIPPAAEEARNKGSTAAPADQAADATVEVLGKQSTASPLPSSVTAFEPPASLPSSPVKTHDPHTALSVGSDDANVFLSYQPEGPSPVPIMRQGNDLKWLPPNTSTPAAMRRTDLPIFTPSSAIPFAAQLPAKQPDDRQKSEEEIISKDEHSNSNA